MLLFDLIAEQRIAEAIARGELAKLPGEGRPLNLGDDALVPEDLRMAYRILKNSGHVPAEIGLLHELRELQARIVAEADGPARIEALRKLALVRTRPEAAGCSSVALCPEGPYFPALLDRFGRRS